MRSKKATRSQIRRHNQQLILRAIHSGLADNRAALASETGLAKPTVSDLISDLIDGGFLVEVGRGKSTETGGKRPRLLEFVPDARQVIGVSISEHGINGLLTDLNGEISAEHQLEFETTPEVLDIDDVIGVINGLIAQLDSPLLCLGIGIPGSIDPETGMVYFTDSLEWKNLPLATVLSKEYDVPIYVQNNTQLTAIARFAFEASSQSSNLAILLINSTIEIGYVLGDTDYHFGRNVSWLKLEPHQKSIQQVIGWKAIKQRVAELKKEYPDSVLNPHRLRFLDIRYGVSQGDEASQIIHHEIEDTLAPIISWIVTLLHPDNLALAGGIADLGSRLLDNTLEKTSLLMPESLLSEIHFSLVSANRLSALGAVAFALQHNLGIIQWQNESAS